MRSHYDITNTDHLPEVTLEGFETVTMRVRRHAREQHDIGFTWHSWRDSPFEREGCDLVETIKEWSHRAAMIANQKMANAQKKNRTAMERWRKGGREQFVKGDTSVGLLRTMLARQRW